MANPFIARRPWAVAVVIFLLGPFIGMLYLGRGRLALIYFALDLIIIGVVFAYFPQFVASGATSTTVWLAELPVVLAGIVQGYVLARRREPDTPLPGYARWYVLAGLLLFSPALALFLRMFVYQPFNATSGSMRPSIEVGDYFLASKFAYRWRAPERGDPIIFHVPSRGGASFIKRIVGLPGERIQLRGGIVFIDGVKAPQRRAGTYAVDCDEPQPCRADLYQERLPNGRTYPVLDRGAMPLDNTQEFRVPADTYFVLGDDRDESMDSRLQDFGFVARDDIIGPAVYKFAVAGHWTWQVIR